MSSSRKIAGIVLCFLSAFLLLGCVIAFLVMRSVFTDAPMVRTPLSELDPADRRMAQMKTAEAISRIRNASGETPPQELALSGREFEALTETVLNLTGQFAGNMRIGGVPLRDTALKLNNDSFRFSYSHDTGMKTPFGSRVNVQADLDIRIENGASSLRIGNTKMGNLAMPSAMRGRLEDAWRKFQQSPGHQRLLDAVESLSVENGELRVRYRPYQAKQNFAPAVLRTMETALNPSGILKP